MRQLISCWRRIFRIDAACRRTILNLAVFRCLTDKRRRILRGNSIRNIQLCICEYFLCGDSLSVSYESSHISVRRCHFCICDQHIENLSSCRICREHTCIIGSCRHVCVLYTDLTECRSCIFSNHTCVPCASQCNSVEMYVFHICTLRRFRKHICSCCFIIHKNISKFKVFYFSWKLFEHRALHAAYFVAASVYTSCKRLCHKARSCLRCFFRMIFRAVFHAVSRVYICVVFYAVFRNVFCNFCRAVLCEIQICRDRKSSFRQFVQLPDILRFLNFHSHRR